MSWSTYVSSLIRYPQFGFSLDSSLMDLDDAFLAKMAPKVEKAFADIAALEGGAIANPDEGRMVGHYWLRNPDLAPDQTSSTASARSGSQRSSSSSPLASWRSAVSKRLVNEP